jgi:AcrR family transcriptional regulator
MAQRSKKDHIAAAALPLFLENGFKGTSIDMVVRVSGVSKPTVYNHFPDKAAPRQGGVDAGGTVAMDRKQ